MKAPPEPSPQGEPVRGGFFFVFKPHRMGPEKKPPQTRGLGEREKKTLEPKYPNLFFCCLFFLKDTATTETHPLPLHDALPTSFRREGFGWRDGDVPRHGRSSDEGPPRALPSRRAVRVGFFIGSNATANGAEKKPPRTARLE